MSLILRITRTGTRAIDGQQLQLMTCSGDLYLDVWFIINRFTCDDMPFLSKQSILKSYYETAVITSFVQYLSGERSVKRKTYLLRIVALFSQ